MSRSLRILIVATSMLITLLPGVRAFAQKRIAVLDIEDAPDGKLRADIVSVITGKHKVISSKTYKRTAKRMRADTMTSENLARVAKAVKADGVLTGSVTESRGRYVLRLHLRSGRTGNTVQKLKLRLDRPRLSKRMREQLGKQLMVAIAQLKGVDSGDSGQAEGGGSEEEIEVVTGPEAKNEDPKTKPISADHKDTDDDTEASGGGDDDSGSGDDSRASSGDGSGSDDDGSDNDDGARPGPSVASTSRRGRGSSTATRVSERNRPRQLEARRAASLMVGPGVVVRNLDFTLAEPFDEAPNGYKGPVSPGVVVRGDLYPLQLTKLADSILSSIGFAFRYERVLGLQTSIDTGVQSILAPTDLSGYSVGVRLRYRFAGLPSKPTVTLGAGTGRLSFTVDHTELPLGLALDVPNTSYKFLEPGVWLGLVAHPRVHLSIGGQLLLVTNAGDVQELDQYGAATITSFALDAAVEYLITANWRVRASGAYTAVTMDFLGNGEQTYLRDGDPGDIDVLSASDRYVSAALTAGYTF